MKLDLPRLTLQMTLGDLIRALIQWASTLEEQDKRILKNNADLEIAGRFIIKSPSGVRVAITTDDLGNLSGEVL